MKKEIQNMLRKGKGDTDINNICQLRYWTVDALGNTCDKMELHFKYVSGIKGGKSYPVNARDYDGIISEVSALIQTYMSECAAAMVSNLSNGYKG